MVNKNIADQLREIEIKKSALQNIIDVVDQIECGEHGLRLLLILGKKTHHSPEQSITFFEAIRNNFGELSTARIRENLHKLQQRIHDDINMVLRLTQNNAPDKDNLKYLLSHQNKQNIHDTLHQFLRRTQTAISLTALLQQRDIQFDEPPISIPKEIIEKRISELDQRQKKYIGYAKQEMQVMRQDINTLLKAPDLPETIANKLKETLGQLHEDLVYLQSRKTIDDLPYTFENLSDQDQEYNNPASPVATEKDHHQDEELQDNTKNTQRGFWMQLITWLTTPTHVSWDQARTWKRDNKPR